MMENIKRYKSPEEVGITFKEATLEDITNIVDFLGRQDIDSLFVPSLSDPVRGMTIRERVERKISNGKWIIAIQEKKVIGCMAIVPARVTKEVQLPKKEGYISKGISFDGWNKNIVWELSTVVVDLELLRKEGVKGVGGSLLNSAKNWVRAKGLQNGLLTDSWVGGDMGGFIMAMNAKEYKLHNKEEKIDIPDTLMRIYTDPAKRGEKGPPTVIYGIPLDSEDWRFFESKKKEMEELKKEYENIEKSLYS